VLRKFSIARKYFVYNYRVTVARKFATFAAQKLLEHPFDVVVAPASLTEVAFLDTDLPIVLVEDATFALLHNYYPQYSNLTKSSVRTMNAISERAIKRANLLIYSTEWAACSAIEDYHADPQKVHVVPMGANFEHIPSREIIQERKKSGRCRLLFVGVDWHRKGGPISYEALLSLEEMGIEAELIICGCTPPNSFLHKSMRIIPYLDKNDVSQRKQLEHLYLTSDFLLLPTRSECFGLVFCEANAFGLPVITTQTGGVPEVVRNGENGFVLPFNAKGTEYAQVIARIYREDEQYYELVKSSRAAYDTRLNWDNWGKTVNTLITEMLYRESGNKISDVSSLIQ
jgi:glycosyltransferase involved in cell wall biosynthesis